MKIKPLAKYQVPEYPRETEFCPSQNNQMPFISKKAMLFAIISLFIQNNQAENKVSTKASTQTVTIKSKTQTLPTTSERDIKRICAPVFEHGDGQGVAGCVAVSYPVFISELDAQQVITKIFSQYGVKFDSFSKLIPDLQIVSYQETMAEKDSNTEFIDIPNGSKPLSLDLYSSESNLGIVFVTEEDYEDLGGSKRSSSIVSWDTKAVARKLVPQIDSYGQFTCGVFYDPIIDASDFEKNSDIAELNTKIKNIEKELANIDTLRTTQMQDLFNEYFSTSEKKNCIESESKIKKYCAAKEKIFKKYDAKQSDLEITKENLSNQVRVEINKRAQKLALENLQAQVNDFIVWLKNKGIIKD